jgi:enediyne biosynthesis protein E4
VMNLNARPILLHNSAASGHSWVGVKLQGTHSNRDAIGARLTLRSSNGTMTRWIVGGGSFLSTNDRRVVFGLGRAREAGALEILWPDRRKQTVSNLKLNSYTTITEPAGDGGK